MPSHDFGDGVTNLFGRDFARNANGDEKAEKVGVRGALFRPGFAKLHQQFLERVWSLSSFLLFFFFQPLFLLERASASSCVREHILTNNLSSTSTSSAKQHVPLSSKTTVKNTPHHTQCFGYFRHTRHTHLRRGRLDTRRRNQFLSEPHWPSHP